LAGRACQCLRDHPGILTTLLAGRGSQLTPISAQIAFIPTRAMPDATFGRVTENDACYAWYRQYLQRIIDEPFAVFMSA
jgi:hypothetical protein